MQVTWQVFISYGQGKDNEALLTCYAACSLWLFSLHLTTFKLLTCNLSLVTPSDNEALLTYYGFVERGNPARRALLPF